MYEIETIKLESVLYRQFPRVSLLEERRFVAGAGMRRPPLGYRQLGTFLGKGIYPGVCEERDGAPCRRKKLTGKARRDQLIGYAE